MKTSMNTPFYGARGGTTEKSEALTISAQELGTRSLMALKVYNLEQPIGHLLELCGGGMLSGLTGALSTCFIVQKYSYVDIINNAKRIALHKLQEPMEQYP